MNTKIGHILMTDDLVFVWGPGGFDPNTYDTHISMFTRRHYENANANNAKPWPFEEIKIRARKPNGEFVYIIGTDFDSFKRFVEDWISSPRETMIWSRYQIEVQEGRIREVQTVKNLTDFPHVAHEVVTVPPSMKDLFSRGEEALSDNDFVMRDMEC